MMNKAIKHRLYWIVNFEIKNFLKWQATPSVSKESKTSLMETIDKVVQRATFTRRNLEFYNSNLLFILAK
jgi:hypothetical protein